jgi:subtilisin family serine protease
MRKLLFILFVISPIFLFAQNKYYWKHGKKVELTENLTTEIVYEKKEKSFKIEKSENVKNVFEKSDNRNGKYKIIEFNNPQFRKSFDKSSVKSVSVGLTDSEGNEMWLSHFVVVKFKTEFSIEVVSDIIKKYESQFIENEFGILKFEIADIEEVLQFSNEIYESGYVKWSQPDFMINVFPDTWEKQYYLNNKDHVYCGFDNDIDALEVWNLTRGCANITVAVIDDGVEDHPDLRDDGGNTRVLNGFTPSGVTTNGRPGTGDKHGQACAGIIAASHNANIRGIAPNIRILPVKVRFGYGIPSSEYASAIRWAYQNGADILSNSWGGGSDQNVIDAIDEAQTQGRNGRGAVVLFSSGNDGANSVSAYSNVAVAVGAINKYDKPASLLKSLSSDKRYTNIGSGQDIVAYGGDVDCEFWSGDCPGDIRTIDRTGSNGYNNGDYNDNFSGTSAACPQVSGVAALILSINPNLTRQEVENILFNTAVDLGASGRDDIYGYGKVNAYSAVKSALQGLGYNLKFNEGFLTYSKTKDNFKVSFIGKPSCTTASGIYWCDVYKAEATIPYSSNWFWYQGDGISGANPNTGNYWVDVVNDNSTIKITTFFYYIRTNSIGQTINRWVPADPSMLSSRKYLISPTQNVEYSGIVSANHNLQLLATYSISLSAGFNSELGSTFSAEIVSASQTFACLPNPNRVTTLKSVKAENSTNTLATTVDENIYYNNNISIYPNPNQGNFIIDLSGKLEKNASIEIYNLTGQVLFKTAFFENKQNVIFTKSTGIYEIKIFNGNNVYSDKLILE